MLPSDLMRDCRAALSLLTRLPLPAPATFPNPPACWAWPLAGAVVSGLAAGGAMLALAAGLTPGLAAAGALMIATLATGALHEDGLADCADGFWGGWTRERRLEIMKDSHIGTYGVLALIFVTLGRWSALSSLLAAGQWPALIAAGMVSRVPMAALMAALPNARGNGLSASVGRPSRKQAGLATGLALAAALALIGSAALIMALTVTATTLALVLLARRKIGGQTGDVLGASQQLAELAALTASVSLL